MKTILSTFLLSITLFASNAFATTIFYQADNVSGVATVNYGLDVTGPTSDVPTFNFAAINGSVTHNLGSYTAGRYTIDITLHDLVVDQYLLGDIDFSIGAVNLPTIPLAGSYQGLTWAFNPNAGIDLAFDFDFDTLDSISNMDVNGFLLSQDPNHNGVMDADVSWSTFRVELNSVPEPSTVFLMSIGILGFSVKRKIMARK